MEDFLYQDSIDCKSVTPNELALKLLMGDDIEDFSGMLQMFVDGDNNLSQNMSYDTLCDQFQVLITIYMEMVFGILKINHVVKTIEQFGDVDEKTLDALFIPDLSQFTIDDMLKMFQYRFKKVRVYMSIHEITDTDESNDRDFGFYKDYFCRIILKDSIEGQKHFDKNNSRLDPKVRYTFVINSNINKNCKNLNDFYAVVTLPNKLKAKISFSPINIIVKDHHIGF
jgi:hypothetical protein